MKITKLTLALLVFLGVSCTQVEESKPAATTTESSDSAKKSKISGFATSGSGSSLRLLENEKVTIKVSTYDEAAGEFKEVAETTDADPSDGFSILVPAFDDGETVAIQVSDSEGDIVAGNLMSSDSESTEYQVLASETGAGAIELLESAPSEAVEALLETYSLPISMILEFAQKLKGALNLDDKAMKYIAESLITSIQTSLDAAVATGKSVEEVNESIEKANAAMDKAEDELVEAAEEAIADGEDVSIPESEVTDQIEAVEVAGVESEEATDILAGAVETYSEEHPGEDLIEDIGNSYAYASTLEDLGVLLENAEDGEEGNYDSLFATLYAGKKAIIQKASKSGDVTEVLAYFEAREEGNEDAEVPVGYEEVVALADVEEQIEVISDALEAGNESAVTSGFATLETKVDTANDSLAENNEEYSTLYASAEAEAATAIEEEIRENSEELSTGDSGSASEEPDMGEPTTIEPSTPPSSGSDAEEVPVTSSPEPIIELR